MAESLLEKANRLGIKPVGTGETLLQKAQRLGIQPMAQPEEKKPGYFSRVASDFKEVGQEITEDVRSGARALEDSQSGKKDPILAGVDIFRTGLRTAGGVAKAALSPILEAPGIKQASEFVAGKLAENSQVQGVVRSAMEIAEKYPNAAKDAEALINIVSLGGGRVALKEGKLVAQDVAQGTKLLLTESEESVQKGVIEMFKKNIKPTARKTLSQTERYDNNVLTSLKTIKANVDQLNIEDDLGELVTGRTPQTLNELAQAVDQTKGLVFRQYDDLATKAGRGGAVVDARPIAKEVLKVAQNKALQVTNPELVKYAEGWAERLTSLGTIDTQTTQEIIKNLNNSLQAFYRNPTFESATRVSIDAGIVNNFRKALDKSIEGATGAEYQALKNQYAALKAIENDVVRAAQRDARKNVRGLLDYTDIFTSGQMVGGILSLNPAMFTKGAVERGFKEYIRFLNDPNRAVSNMFDMLDTTTVKPFVPQSKTINYLKNPKVGLSTRAITPESVAKKVDANDIKIIREYLTKSDVNTFSKAQPMLEAMELTSMEPKLQRRFLEEVLSLARGISRRG